MHLHVHVTPIADEALIVDADEVDAGFNWLETEEAAGRITSWLPFPKTGGYMNVLVPADDMPTALAQLREWMAPYPLLRTITYLDDVEEVVAKRAGFDVLAKAVSMRVRTADIVNA